MTPTRPCLGCGQPIPRGSRCGACTPKRKRDTPGRGGSSTARRFREETLAKTGGACAVCGSTEGVEAHHATPLRDGGSNDAAANGVPLCRAHHGERESASRRQARL